MKKLFLPLIIILSLFVAGAEAGNPKGNSGTTNLSFVLTYSYIADPVDYETWCHDCFNDDYKTGSPWVVNPSNCMWDSDDAYEFTASPATLSSGQSAIAQACSYSVGNENNFPNYLVTAVHIVSPSSSLQISETWSWNTGSYTTQLATTPIRYGAGLWLYFDCVSGVLPQPLNFVTIPDSNGGTASPVENIVTITNTGKSVSKTYGRIAGGTGVPGQKAGQMGCVNYRTP